MKGQTAIEYLMTYGWAILIILIVAGVLAYYGIFSPSSFLGPTARGFGQIQVLNPWSLTTGGTLTLDLANRVGGQTASITTINATINDAAAPVVCAVTGSPVDIATSSDVVVTAACGAIANSAAGDSYTAALVITYIYNNGNFTTAGTITGTLS